MLLIFVIVLVFAISRAIENIYKEYCEQKGKEQPQCLDSLPSEDLMLSDSSVWKMVRTR